MQSLATDRDVDAGSVRVYATVSTDDDQRVLLRDRESGTTRWAVTDDDVSPGVVLDCLLEGDGPSRIVASRQRTETTLAVGVADRLGQPAGALWADRATDRRRVADVIDPPGSAPPTEVHVYSPDADPERFKRRLLTGDVSLEPWFGSLPELDGGARHLTVVLRPATTTVAVYATPADRLDGPVYRHRERLGEDPR